MRRSLFFCFVSLCTSLVTGHAGGSKAADKKPEAASERPTKADAEKAVREVLDAAVATLEADDLPKFELYYAPVEEFREMREAGKLEKYQVGSVTGVTQKWLARLKKFQGGQVDFDDDLFLARVSPAPEPSDVEPKADDKQIPEKPNVEIAKPQNDKLELEGYGSDLAEVWRSAIAALERKEFEAFVDRMFPAGELGRLKERNGKSQLIEKLKTRPEMVERMILDLKDVQAAKPEISSDGSLATYVLPARFDLVDGKPRLFLPAPLERSPNFKPIERTLKFQKVRGSWRFFDNSTRVREEMVRQLSLEPPDIPNLVPRRAIRTSTIKPSLVLERLGNTWRIARHSEGLRFQEKSNSKAKSKTKVKSEGGFK